MTQASQCLWLLRLGLLLGLLLGLSLSPAVGLLLILALDLGDDAIQVQGAIVVYGQHYRLLRDLGLLFIQLPAGVDLISQPFQADSSSTLFV